MQFLNINTDFSRKMYLSSGNDGFGYNANLETEPPQWVINAVEKDLEEREEAELEHSRSGRWIEINKMADIEFSSGLWSLWLRSPKCPKTDDGELMPWKDRHWGFVLSCKDITGIDNTNGSQHLFPRNTDRSKLWSRQGNKRNVTFHGICPSYCPRCKGSFPGCGRKLLPDAILISFKTAVYELLAQKGRIQQLAKERARCKGPYYAALKKMKLAKENSDDAAAKIAEDESVKLYPAYEKEDANFTRAAAIYKEIFNRWAEMGIFNMEYLPRSFYKLAPPP
jgi:hypothetical protein